MLVRQLAVAAVVATCTASIIAAQPLPQINTGQTTTYSPGDDGDLRTGVAWALERFVDNGDGTITDELTQLVWLQNANCAQASGFAPTDPGYSGDGHSLQDDGGVHASATGTK